MPLQLCGLISATLFALGLLAAGSRRFAHRRAIGMGLMLQAGLLLIVAATRQLGQTDGYVVALLGIGLLPLIGLPMRRSCSEANRSEGGTSFGTDPREEP
jgi:NADH:ubiquinone oxidoreductase subunit K